MAVKFLDGITVDGNATFGTGNKFQTTTNVLEGVGENGVYLRSAISSAANPSYSNSDDTNTGMFLPGSDVLGLSTAGSERFRITSAGNVGIGTTNPAYKLSVENSLQVFSSGDTANPKIEGHLLRVTDTANDNPDVEHRYVENDSLNYGFSWFMDGGNNNFSLRRHENSANGTTVFRVNRSNSNVYIPERLGIGLTSPGARLDILQEARISFANGNQYRTRITNTDGNTRILADGDTCSIILGTSPEGTNATAVERMRINSDGNVGIATTSPSFKLDVAGNARASYFALRTNESAPSESAFIYRPASGNLGFGTGSTERMRINSSGNVGIGTTAPAAKLAINGSTRIMGNGSSNNSHVLEFTNSAVVIARSSSNDLNLHAYNAMVFGVSNSAWPTSTERMRITSAGNVGIGTTTPDSKLEVIGNYKQKAADGNTQGFTLSINSSTDAVSLNNFYNASMTFSTNNSVKMTILGGGNVGIGTTSPSQKLEVVGKAKITTSLAVGAITPSATTGRIDASNDIVAFSSSDIRLKNNIKTIDKALDKVNSIQGVEFDWIEKEIIHGNKGRDVGVIAQEIEKILPEVVTTRDNGYKAVKYEKIVPLLIEAIKDLSRQVDGLKRLI